jgi:hypothetical protein
MLSLASAEGRVFPVKTVWWMFSSASVSLRLSLDELREVIAGILDAVHLQRLGEDDWFCSSGDVGQILDLAAGDLLERVAEDFAADSAVLRWPARCHTA